jgi:aminoglycoside 3-N-acetyltransferase
LRRKLKIRSFDYDLLDIFKALKNIDLKLGDVIYITGDLSRLGAYKYKRLILSDLYQSIKKKIGEKGTICFPTHSWSVLKSNLIFNSKTTKSETGVFTEYLRKKNSIRQDHPYSSISSIGKYSKFICTNNSLAAYGKKSPFARLIKLKAKIINFGLHPRYCCSSVHHSEFILKVPYRFKKFFIQKVIQNNKLITKKYSLFVLKKNFMKIKRNKNKIIFKHFTQKNKILKSKLGRSFIYSYSLSEFYKDNISLLKKNKYSWLGLNKKKLINLKN